MTPERLIVPLGSTPSAARVAALAAAINEATPLSGRTERLTKYPWGVIHNARGRGGGGYVSPVFQPSVAPEGDGYSITWQRGLIAGVEPTIDGQPIGAGDPETGLQPVFRVERADFGDGGEALIYFDLHLNIGGWYVEKIAPFAVPETPPTVPWHALKLALILFDDGTFWRALHTNQGHLAINRRSSGLAQHLFWGKF